MEVPYIDFMPRRNGRDFVPSNRIRFGFNIFRQAVIFNTDGSITPIGVSLGEVTANDIEITDATKGLILKSPNGSRFRIGVDNNGALTTTQL